MSELRIVTPEDIGNTIVMGSDNKYNVAVDQLQLPDNITGLNLEGSTLKITTKTGEHSQDLSGILPAITADVFLKNVTRQDNNLVFTVGNKNNTNDDNTFTIDVSDLLPVKVNNSLTGNGTTGSPLGVKIAPDLAMRGDQEPLTNLLKQTEGGLAVTTQDINEKFFGDTVQVYNASGERVLGVIFPPPIYVSL